MATIAAENILNWILSEYPQLKYISISGNLCTDKKVSAVNGILGRGKYLIAELKVPRQVVREVLKTTPEQIVELHLKKNLLGGILAGSLRTANAHFANMLLAMYLATGQDAANIVEGSQGIVHAEVINQDLYFSVTLPNIIVGTVGNGKNLPFVQENFKKIGFGEVTARKLAIIIAASVLCGEISLLAAQTNQGELVRAHVSLERAK
jgi:hydroxymethylglutaryl-CoA reductase (NADPH)